MDTEVNQLKKSLGKAFLWLLLLLAVATGTTFAWFNLTGMRHTNVTPMAGTVSKGGSTLLISTSESGPFDKTCELVLTGNPESLKPLSTDQLEHFSGRWPRTKTALQPFTPMWTATAEPTGTEFSAFSNIYNQIPDQEKCYSDKIS